MLFRQKDNFLTKCAPHRLRLFTTQRAKITGPQLCIHHRPAGGVLFGQPCKGVGHRQCGSLQEGKGILLRPQQVEIGRQGGKDIGRIVQSGIHGQAAHPCPGVAHGGFCPDPSVYRSLWTAGFSLLEDRLLPAVSCAPRHRVQLPRPQAEACDPGICS